jgi:hypothetical protein
LRIIVRRLGRRSVTRLAGWGECGNYVVSGQGEIRGGASREPADVFTGGDVGEGDVVLEPDVFADRLGHDPGPPHRHTTSGGLLNDVEPGPPPRATIVWVVAVTGLPRGEHRIGTAVPVPHLQMHRRPVGGGEEFGEWWNVSHW